MRFPTQPFFGGRVKCRPVFYILGRARSVSNGGRYRGHRCRQGCPECKSLILPRLFRGFGRCSGNQSVDEARLQLSNDQVPSVRLVVLVEVKNKVRSLLILYSVVKLDQTITRLHLSRLLKRNKIFDSFGTVTGHKEKT